MLKISTALLCSTFFVLGCANTLDVKERPKSSVSIDRSEVAQTLRKAKPSFDNCYIKEKVQEAQILVVEFDIAQSGQVSSIRIPKGDVSQSIEQCVKRELLSLRFSKHSGEPVRVQERLKFQPQ